MFTKIRTIRVRHFRVQSNASVLSDNILAVAGYFIYRLQVDLSALYQVHYMGRNIMSAEFMLFLSGISYFKLTAT
jgi:hypothetical protein